MTNIKPMGYTNNGNRTSINPSKQKQDIINKLFSGFANSIKKPLDDDVLEIHSQHNTDDLIVIDIETEENTADDIQLGYGPDDCILWQDPLTFSLDDSSEDTFSQPCLDIPLEPYNDPLLIPIEDPYSDSSNDPYGNPFGNPFSF